MIWSTPVTALQLFGYTIALAGLIYYKTRGEQAQPAYTKVTGDDNSLFNRFRRSLWARVGAGVLVIFVVLAVANGFSSSGRIDTSAAKTWLTGVPDHEMADGYHPAIEDVHYEHDFGGAWDKASNHPTHYTDDVVDPSPSTHPLDIVLFVSPSTNGTLELFEQVLIQPRVSTMNPRVTTYGEFHSSFPVTQHIQLPKISSPSIAYMDYISKHYDALAEHTIFLHSDVDAYHLPSTISSRFTAHTGVAELSEGGYSVCGCLKCVDSSNTTLVKTDELYALTNLDTCSESQKLLVSLLFLHD